MDFQPYPVFVVAADTIIGLTVMRSLGRRGIPVYAAATVNDALGPHSVFCRGWFRMPNDPEQAITAVREHLRKWKITHIIGISENHISSSEPAPGGVGTELHSAFSAAGHL